MKCYGCKNEIAWGSYDKRACSQTSKVVAWNSPEYHTAKDHYICRECSKPFLGEIVPLESAYITNRRDNKQQYRFEARRNDAFQTIISDDTIVTLDNTEYGPELSKF